MQESCSVEDVLLRIFGTHYSALGETRFKATISRKDGAFAVWSADRNGIRNKLLVTLMFHNEFESLAEPLKFAMLEQLIDSLLDGKAKDRATANVLADKGPK